MKKSLLLFIPAIFVVVLAVVFLSAQNSSKNSERAAPRLFAEGIVNTGGDEYNPTFTPDGKTVYFTRRIDRRGNEAIMFSKLENGKWTEPRTAEFSGKFYDKEPMLSTDGKRIFFASMRPNNRDEKANFDIWMAEKNAAGWSEPKNLGANVNSPGYDNYPSIAADGTLYFASVRADGRRDNDLYRSRLINGEYQKAENLGDVINTPATEADPFVAPDQSYLIICSDRAGGAGEGDLYISFNRNGKWTAPQSLGANFNTAAYEYTPLVSPDGKTFYFSRGWGDIYQADAGSLNLSQLKQAAQTANKNAKYLFYLHGKIVEDQGAKAVSERYGAYEYEKIVEGFRAEGFRVISEVRPKDTDVEKYAEKVAAEVRQLLKDGVAPENITVVGASRGAFITILASTYIKNRNVNFVIIAGCSVSREFLNLANLYGNVLSIYEKSDVTGSCKQVFDDAEGLNKQKEVMLETGLAHGFIYRPMREWLIPTLDWANYQR
jgi:Tol biopolymer transport system component